jgi:hypothetical protein
MLLTFCFLKSKSKFGLLNFPWLAEKYISFIQTLLFGFFESSRDLVGIGKDGRRFFIGSR